MSPVGAGNRCCLHEYADGSGYSCMAEDRVECLGVCRAQKRLVFGGIEAGIEHAMVAVWGKLDDGDRNRWVQK